MSNRKIAFIAPEEYVEALKFAGFSVFGAENKESAYKKAEELEKDDYAMIFISQDVFPDKMDLERVVSLPGISKKEDEDYLKKEISKALGGDYQI